VKIGPLDSEITLLNLKKRKKLTQVKYITRLAGLPSGLKKNIEYELNINFNYHIGSHIKTKLNRMHLTTFVLANKRHNTLLELKKKRQ